MNVGKEDYKKIVAIKMKSVDGVFESITRQIPHWWTEDFEGASLKPGDVFTVRFGTTFKMMRIEEIVHSKKIVWKCMDTLIDLPHLVNQKEWKGTTIIWEINANGDDAELTLTHIGLTPAMQCYEVCERGWESFLSSLKKLLETNQGTPFSLGQFNSKISKTF